MSCLPTEFLSPATSDADLDNALMDLIYEGNDHALCIDGLNDKTKEEIAVIALNHYDLYNEALLELDDNEVWRALTGRCIMNDVMLAVAKIRKRLIDSGIALAKDRFRELESNFDRAEYEAACKADIDLTDYKESRE